MKNISIEIQEHYTDIRFNGELTIYTVAQVYQACIAQLSFDNTANFYFEEIEEVDTAGMQLLILLFQTTQKKQQIYHIKSTSQCVQAYVDLFNFQHYFNTDAVEEL